MSRLPSRVIIIESPVTALSRYEYQLPRSGSPSQPAGGRAGRSADGASDSTVTMTVTIWKPDPLHSFRDCGPGYPVISFQKFLFQRYPILLPNSIFLVWDILAISRIRKHKIRYTMIIFYSKTNNLTQDILEDNSRYTRDIP